MGLSGWKKTRWAILGLFVGAMVINYLVRSIMGVAAPVIMSQQGISNQQYGLITSAMQLGIMFQPLAGMLLDRVGLRLGFAAFALVWSLITIAHGLARGWLGFAGLRLALGLAEGSGQPAGQKLVAEWFPARERGLAGGIYNIGASLGAVLAPPLVAAAIYTTGSWRMAFVGAGVVSLLWSVLWYVFYAPVAQHRAVSDEERQLIANGQEAHLKAAPSTPLWDLLRQRNLWGIALPRLLADPVWGMLQLWLPLYLARERGFDMAHIAMLAWLPFLAADAGCLFGPAVASFLQRRGVVLINARRITFTLGAVMMMGMGLVGLVASPYVALALLCLAGFAHQTLSVTVITLASDLFPRNDVGTVAGFSGLAANLGVLLFSLSLGSLIDTVGYSPFFLMLGCLDLIGAVLLWTLVRRPS
jgi:ACS family hexuronate transporter-like MFS transporter